MNLPFAPDGTKRYAPVALVDAITNAGHDTEDVQVVVEKPNAMGWLVHFQSTTDVLSIP